MEDTNQNQTQEVQIVMKIEEYCNMLDNKSALTEEIHNMNKILTEFANFENYEYLKMLLYHSSSAKAKFYAANSLLSILTQNYLTISLEDKEQMYISLLTYIVNLIF